MTEHILLIWLVALVVWGTVIIASSLILSIVLAVYHLRYMRQFSLVTELLARQKAASIEEYVAQALADAQSAGRVAPGGNPEETPPPPSQPGDPGYKIGTLASDGKEMKDEAFPT